MILFAKEEPRLYQLVFMSADGDERSFDDIYKHLRNVANECLIALQTDYGLSKDAAKTLFEHTWIHIFGTGTLCTAGMCHFSGEQISKMLTQDFTAMMTMLKFGKENENE